MHAVEILEILKDVYGDQPFGKLAQDILAEGNEDRETLKGLAERVKSGSSTIKELAAWVAEKASGLKLSHDPAHSIGTFEALEFLTLSFDSRLESLNYIERIGRAESQHKRVKERRLLLARSALRHSVLWSSVYYRP
jgi:hypothetical protein